MNTKKTPDARLQLLAPEARRERLESDNRLIACRKVTGDATIATVVVSDSSDHDRASTSTRSSPDGIDALFERLHDGPGAIEVIVETTQWSVPVAELLAALRDKANRRIAVHVGDTRVGDAVDQRMVSLGYRRQSANDGLYLFDIESYKDTPDWLNPRNWANPELWDKYRW